MTAYFIVHRRDIRDTELLKKYAEGVGETIERFNGSVVVRADGFEPLEGEWNPGRKGDDSRPERLTVIAFPDMATLKSWYESEDYAPFRKIRQEAAVCDAAAVEGRAD